MRTGVSYAVKTSLLPAVELPLEDTPVAIGRPSQPHYRLRTLSPLYLSKKTGFTTIYIYIQNTHLKDMYLLAGVNTRIVVDFSGWSTCLGPHGTDK